MNISPFLSCCIWSQKAAKLNHDLLHYAAFSRFLRGLGMYGPSSANSNAYWCIKRRVNTKCQGWQWISLLHVAAFSRVIFSNFILIQTFVYLFGNKNICFDLSLIRSFKKAVNDVIMSRRAIRNMNTL